MSAEILLSGYAKDTHQLAFCVYCTAIPETERRKSHDLEHLTAHDLLGAALLEDFGLRHVKITRRGLEKPALLHENLHMNLSHCKGLAIAAAGRIPLGIDCERPRTVKDKLLDKLCTPQEAAFIRAAEDKSLAFVRFWTLKEAYGKLTGRGIREPFDQLDFSFSGGGITFAHPDAGKLMFFQLIRENQHVIALCIPRTELTIKTEYDILRG